MLSHNGTEMLNLPAIPLRQRIMGVFGKKLNQELLSLDIDTTMVKYMDISVVLNRPVRKGHASFSL